MNFKKWVAIVVVVAAIAAGGIFYWQQQLSARLPDGIVSSNGRIEADRINIATKLAGRIEEISVDEGDMVDTGQIVARMETTELEARIRQAEAEIRGTEKAKQEATASIMRAKSELQFTEAEFTRVQKLHAKGYATAEKLDQRHYELQAAEASYRAAIAGAEQSSEVITSAREKLKQLKSVLDDTLLKAPQRGRVQYRLAEPGEVLGAGGRVLTLLDISDVYMTIFLPASDAGKLIIGSDARIILDPIPEYVIPATVTFVAAEAQFTPKEVETSEERAKLMFRVKLKINPALLKKHEDRVKTGVRGMAYVRLLGTEPWPDKLQVKVPE